MDQNEKELHLFRVLSGKIRIQIDNNYYYLGVPSPHDKYVAQQIFFDIKRQAGFEGILTEKEALAIMLRNGMWSKDLEDELESLPRLIENLKITLFESQLKEKLFKATRKTLNTKKDRLNKLANKKGALSSFTRSGLASATKLQYKLYTSVQTKEGNYIFKGENYWDEKSSLIESIFKQYLKEQISEEIIRELSHSDPWRTMWVASKAEGSVFGLSAVELTAEQVSLVNWSRFYDNIHESAECPSESVIKDDDLLDGWLIKQNRKREKDKFEKEMEAKLGKNKNADEVYLVADNAEYAQKIDSMNSPMAKGVKKSRERQIDKRPDGIAVENLPDSKRDMRMQANEQFRNKLKGG